MADVLEVNEQNFESEIAGSEKPAIIDFWAPWCGPCRMMHPIIETLAEEYEGRAVVARCNVDDNPGLAGRFSVSAIPTLVLFKGGADVDKMIGVSPIETIKQRLDAQF